jgi:NAD(P)H-nitrite reductase large subunit
MVVEIMPYSGGLKRNIVQCLDDFNIPLNLSHPVVKIHGNKRLSAVTIAQVDQNRNPIPGTEETIECDTLLLSVGLIPENELSRKAGISINPKTSGPIVDERLQTSIDGIFACGNVLHVHDLVDHVSSEAYLAGKNAVTFIEKTLSSDRSIQIIPMTGVRYTVPSVIKHHDLEDIITIRFRTSDVYKDVYLSVYLDDERVTHTKKRILTPGEMEQVLLPKKWIEDRPELIKISILIEKD